MTRLLILAAVIAAAYAIVDGWLRWTSGDYS